MTTPTSAGLDDAFGVTLQRLLRAAAPASKALVGFVATGAPERGFWVVSLGEGSARRGTEADRPDVVVEGSGAVLALLLAGALDVGAAIERGVLVVRGDRTALVALAGALSPPDAR